MGDLRQNASFPDVRELAVDLTPASTGTTSRWVAAGGCRSASRPRDSDGPSDGNDSVAARIMKTSDNVTRGANGMIRMPASGLRTPASTAATARPCAARPCQEQDDQLRPLPRQHPGAVDQDAREGRPSLAPSHLAMVARHRAAPASPSVGVRGAGGS
ncbi:MAG: hypothetical protein HZY73_16220 [Micropruina sp.]|nr:MAG: hypothetical protein HZY73_16220 [Micropruina sp.]